jgi:hypothetical protein
MSQDLASHGSIEPSDFWCVSESRKARAISDCGWSPPTAGSRQVGSRSVAKLMVPPEVGLDEEVTELAAFVLVHPARAVAAMASEARAIRRVE